MASRHVRVVLGPGLWLKPLARAARRQLSTGICHQVAAPCPRRPAALHCDPGPSGVYTLVIGSIGFGGGDNNASGGQLRATTAACALRIVRRRLCLPPTALHLYHILTPLPAGTMASVQVLRFYAYFKEAVHESPAEDERVRKVIILLYLVDMQIEVVEQKEGNSGMPQGTFIKRHRIPKKTGEPYEFTDLQVGTEVTFYGRTLRVVDCDSFTREFYASNGIEQGPSEGYPETPLDATRRVAATAAGEYHGIKSHPLKKFMEASLGKTGAGRGQAVDLKRFLENDRKVLRFYCEWDDSDRLYGDKTAFTLHYFLAEDTVEVAEVHVANSGKDPFGLFLRKQKLPKDWHSSLREDREQSCEDDPPTESYYRPEDLKVGGIVDVYGRKLLIKGCDPFTRNWYLATFGYEQGDLTSEEKEEEEVPTLGKPSYTGFGDEDDSMASAKSLIPKPPKKDWRKWTENEGKILRFSAKLARAIPEDRHRQFVIQLYLEDDTLMIYEPAVRNSGIVGGKFLNREKHRKADGSLYQVSDFTIGNEVTIHKRTFLVIDTDTYTRKQRPEVVPPGHGVPAGAEDPAAKELLGRLRAAARRRGAHGIHGIGRMFRIMDDNGDRGLDERDLRTGFADYGVDLSEDDLKILMAAFDKDGSGRVSFDELLAGLRGEMNHHRLSLVHAAYDKLDVTGDGKVDLEDIRKAYNFSQSEAVLSGEKTVEEAAEDFLDQWDTIKDDNIVSREEFLNYYRGISASIDSDDYFELMMKRAWQI